MVDRAKSLRSEAAGRSWYCPGAGFALLGRGRLAIAAYLVTLGAVSALAWLTVAPGAASVWTTLALVCASGVFFLAEQVSCWKLTSETPRPRFLADGFRVAGAIGWIAAALVLVLFLSRYGSLQVRGNGMSPMLENGERVLYEKRVKAERLRRGTVILFRLSDRSDWGEPESLMIARIVAEPGDRLSIRNGKYLVNEESARSVAAIGSHALVIPVPHAPQTLSLPPNRFFVAQESPTDGLDSRVLSWVETDEIESTRMYLMSLRGVFKRVQ
jgi:signal peptidase I